MNLYSGYWETLKGVMGDDDHKQTHEISTLTLAVPPSPLSRQDFFEHLAHCIKLTDDKQLAIKLGQSAKILSFGLLGLAALNCQTIGQLTRLLVRHDPLRSSGARLHLIETDEHLKVRFFEQKPPIPDFPFLAYELFFSSLIGTMHQLTMKPLDGLHLELVGSGHASFETYSHLLNVPTKTNQEINQLVISRGLGEAIFSTPVHGPSPELQMRLYEGILTTAGPVGGVAGAVRSILLKQIGQTVNIDTVALKLNMSERTLRRRLSDEKTTLRTVRENLWRQVACQFLDGTSLTVAEIGEMLGYSEYANFRRSFIRWTNQSPADYRSR